MSSGESLTARILAEKFPKVRSRTIDNVNGLSMRVLESGDAMNPLVLLLHGFPELAFSWRHQLQNLADSPYYVVAPDLRGYGQTTGWSPDNVHEFSWRNLLKDVIALVMTLKTPRGGSDEKTEAGAPPREAPVIQCTVVGHDFGSPLARWCSMMRPDIFTAVAFMSAPPLAPNPVGSPDLIGEMYEFLIDNGKRHYTDYYQSPNANKEMMEAPGGFKAFLRAYILSKSAESEHSPVIHARKIEDMPPYYVFPSKDKIMSEVVDRSKEELTFLSEDELAAYVESFEQTSLQGGLNWYCNRQQNALDLQIMHGSTLRVPSIYIAGNNDWGAMQRPGKYEVMHKYCGEKFAGRVRVKDAGHWVQQEKPDVVSECLRVFLSAVHAVPAEYHGKAMTMVKDDMVEKLGEKIIVE